MNKSNNDDYTFYFREFVKNAWADIERFREQKNHDLKEALISYAVMQISMCKKVGEGAGLCWSAGKLPHNWSLLFGPECLLFSF